MHYQDAEYSTNYYEYEPETKTGKKRKRTNNPIIQNPNRKRAKARGPLRAPNAQTLFKEDCLNQLGRNAENIPGTEDKIKEQWDNDGKIQEEYKQIASHIFAELQKLKLWEQEMAQYKAHEVTQEEQEGEGSAMRPQLFESAQIKAGKASFLQSVQIFGTNPEDQKETFEEKYKVFRTQNGIRLPQAQVGGAPLNLYELYRNVVLRGGLAQCLRKESFLQIGRKMRLKGTDETLPYSLKIIYFKYLFDFEQEFQVVARLHGKKRIHWEQDYTGAACSRPLKREKLEEVPNGLRDDIYDEEFVKAAGQALMSRKPEAMTWALNRLLYASYQSHSAEFLLIHKNPHIVDGLLGLLGVPEDIESVNAIVPIMNEWKEGSDLKGLCVDLFGPEQTSRRKFALAALRVLVNLSLTARNQITMIDNAHLRTGFLKKIIECEDLTVKSGCMKVLGNIAWRWNLTEKETPQVVEAMQEGLSMYAFDDQHSDMPALAEATLKLICGLSANPSNEQLLSKFLTEDIYKQASFFILSTDLNIRLIALESLCHLCDMNENVCKRMVASTNSLDYMASIVKEAEVPSSIQRACSYLGTKLLKVVTHDAKLAKRFSQHFCAFAAAAAGNKAIYEYSVGLVSGTNAFD